MAMTAFELFGVLKLDAKEFEKGLNNARDKAGSLGSTFSRVGGAVGGALATAARVGMAAVTAATGAAVAFGKASVNAATEFESAFTGVRKTVDATEEEYKQLSDWILEASTRMASSQEEIAGTMEIAGQLGIRGVEGLEKFTETMIMLGDTTNLNAEEAASALAKFGNIAGISAEDTDRIGSTIVALGNNFATTEADIVNMSTRLASAGTIAGFSATDILALSTAMSSVGINAEAGGTAMSTVLTKIGRAVDDGIDPANEKLQLFATTAGMSMEEFTAAWKGDPTVALQGFIKGLNGVIDAGGNVTAILDNLDISGIRETNTIKSLALASDVLTGAVDMANTAFDENIALQREAELRYGTTESAAIQAANSFKNLRIAIGEELKPVYSDLMSFASESMEAMTKGFQEGGLEGLMKSLGEALSNGLAMLNEKLPDFFDAGLALLNALGQGIIDNLDSIIDTAFLILSRFGEELMNALPQIYDILMEVGNRILSSIADAVANTDFSQLAATLKEKIEGAVENFGQSGFSQMFVVATQLIMDLVQGLADAAPELLPAAMDMILTFEEYLIDQLPEMTKAAVELVVGLVEGLTSGDTIGRLLIAAVDIIMALAEGLIDALPRLIESLPVIIEGLVNGLMDLAGRLATAAPELVRNISAGLIKAIPSLIKAVPELIGALVAAFINHGVNLFKAGINLVQKAKEGFSSLDPAQWGRDLIDKFVAGIRGAIDRVKTAVTNVADVVKSILGFSEPEEGPLSNFHTYAPDMMQLFAQGIKDNEDIVMDQLKKSFDFSDVMATQTVNMESGGESRGNVVNGGVTLNIYGAEGQNTKELADVVMDRIMRLMNAGAAVYA